MTRPERRRRLTEAQEIACERATLFRVARRNRKGELLTGHHLYRAETPRKRRGVISRGARPVLPSSEWDAIYRELGLRA